MLDAVGCGRAGLTAETSAIYSGTPTSPRFRGEGPVPLYQSKTTATSAPSAISDRLSYPEFFGTLCHDEPPTSDPVKGGAMWKPSSTTTARTCSSQTVVLRGMPASPSDVLRRRTSEKNVFYGTVQLTVRALPK